MLNTKTLKLKQLNGNQTWLIQLFTPVIPYCHMSEWMNKEGLTLLTAITLNESFLKKEKKNSKIKVKTCSCNIKNYRRKTSPAWLLYLLVKCPWFSQQLRPRWPWYLVQDKLSVIKQFFTVRCPEKLKTFFQLLQAFPHTGQEHFNMWIWWRTVTKNVFFYFIYYNMKGLSGSQLLKKNKKPHFFSISSLADTRWKHTR